jgi:AcrR family transcriptional regulator
MPATGSASRRMPADERRELVLGAARTEFAAHGLQGASTKTIAAGAGISEAYLFQLYGTKRQLFLAVLERNFDLIHAALREAADGASKEEVFTALGKGYLGHLTADEEGLMVFLQGLAATQDEEVRVHVRERYGELYHYVERVSGANDEAVRTLFAYAMLAALAAAMRLPDIGGRDSWASRLLGFMDAFED